MQKPFAWDPQPPPEADPALIQAAFLRWAAEAPARVALRYGGTRYTYGELERRSRGLANRFRSAGLRPGEPIAIVAERRPALVWSILAALRAGLPFMVLDAAYPEAQRRALAAVGAPRLVVGAGAQRLARDLGAALDVPVVDAVRTARGGSALPPPDPEGWAYVLFTSGSTGTPKAVAASHGPLSHFLGWQREVFGLAAEDRFSLLSGLSHDPLLRDIFAPLSLGAVLEIPDPDLLLAPGGLRGWLRRTGCTVVHATPPMGQLIVAGGTARELEALRLVFWGGDMLPPRLLADMQRLAPGVESVNFYGATETPQAVAYFRCPPAAGGLRTPIGFAAPGTTLRIVGEAGEALDAGEEGELVVTSRHLSLGYVADGQIARAWGKSAEDDGARVYRTGDMAVRGAGGEIVLVGRRDDQVKIRGHRVDLAEIAEAIRSEPAVTAVAMTPFPRGDQIGIAAFVVASDGVCARGIRDRLAARLPAHMVPESVRILAALPLLPNGKVDRARLLAIETAPEAERPDRPASAREAELIAAWAPLFGGRPLSPADSFAGRNGDSLGYVHAYLAAQTVIGDPPAAWAQMSISALAAQAPGETTAPAAAKPWVAWMETPILLRAAAIVAIVCIHAHVLPADGGATNALFLVSGFLLTSLQLKQAHAAARLQPVLRYITVIAGPTLLFGAAMYGLRLIQGVHPSLSMLLLGEDLVDWAAYKGGGWTDQEPELWYLHALIHMSALLALALVVCRRFGAPSLRAVLIGLFLLGCVTRFLLPALVLGDGLEAAARQFSLFSVLPTTHLATLCLGGLFAVSPAWSRTTWGLALAYAGLSALLFGLPMGLVLLTSLLVIDLRRLRLPRALLPVVFGVANASLFIYLANMKVLRLLFLLPGGPSPLLQIAATLFVGIAAATVWRRLQGRSSRRARHIVVPAGALGRRRWGRRLELLRADRSG